MNKNLIGNSPGADYSHLRWKLDEQSLTELALGATLLGAGGGGDPYALVLAVREQLRQGHQVEVIPLDSLGDEDLVASMGSMGAPGIHREKLSRGNEGVRELRVLEQHIGQPVSAIIASELGAHSALEPMLTAASTGLPVVDGDGLGRSFYGMDMSTFFFAGLPASPAVICDERGNIIILADLADAHWLERLTRQMTLEMGGVSYFITPLITGAQAKAHAVPGTISQARRIGQAIIHARREGGDPVAVTQKVTGGRLLARGEVVDVTHRTESGFAAGRVQITGRGSFAGRTFTVDFQSVNLMALEGNEHLVTTPDLICIVDGETAEPITITRLSYGQYVAVLGIPCSPQLRTPAALAVVGPRAFGYPVDYRPFA